MNFLALFVAAIVSLAGAHVDRDAKRSFSDLGCMGVYDKSKFTRLDRVCEECYQLFRESDVHTSCRSNCFKNDFFTQCVDALLLQKDQHSLNYMVNQLYGRRRSAIEEITLQHLSESRLVNLKERELNIRKQNIRELNMKDKTIEFQWILSHVDIYGNEKADPLAKKGAELFIELSPLILNWQLRTMKRRYRVLKHPTKIQFITSDKKQPLGVGDDISTDIPG
ncbi:ion transport peptide-like [Caerostris darwini]|uniref:Ion transport peptide-like n=1 Tax=Caerostris darwini TaxID=1538125 RepID=A0AAV4SL66_9ARAC|nr:ion transport peptide-like [Caerostris darwini]